MQVLFLQDVKGVAKKGDIKNVKEGYFKNLLAPKKLAVLATKGVEKQAQKMQESRVIQHERLSAEAKEAQAKLEGLKIELNYKANGETLYGSVKEQDVEKAILDAVKVKLSKENIKGAEHIKTTGDHDLEILLADGIKATVKLTVKAE